MSPRGDQTDLSRRTSASERSGEVSILSSKEPIIDSKKSAINEVEALRTVFFSFFLDRKS